MDDLLNIASKTMEGFNPATDSVDNFEEIKDGEYIGLLEDVTAKTSESTGSQWVSLKFSILNNEEYKNRFIFVNYFFTEKTNSVNCLSLLLLFFCWLESTIHLLKSATGTLLVQLLLSRLNSYLFFVYKDPFSIQASKPVSYVIIVLLHFTCKVACVEESFTK